MAKLHPKRMIRAVRRSLSRLRELPRDASGVALIELAYSLPILLTLGLGGIEIANMATTRMRVSQIALSVADNAARLGQTDNSGVTPTITEADIDAVIDGAMQQGDGIDLQEKGRVIISSLEYSDFYDRQYIHWQRCRGDLDVNSAYGNDTDANGLNGAVLEPLGRGDQKFEGQSGTAIMFVEVYYEYSGILGNYFLDSADMVQEAAFLIRDDRNLGPGLTGGSSQSSCS